MTFASQGEPELNLPNFNLVSILEKLTFCGIIFTLALPLLGDYGPWLFPVGRDIIFKLTIEFLWVLFLILSLGHWDFIRNWKLEIRNFKSPVIVSLLSFWLIMVLATINSVQWEFSFWGNIYKNQGLLTWTHYIAFFFLLIFFLREKKRWQLLLNIAIGVASAVSVIALWQVLQHDFAFRVSATLNNSNYLAAYLVLLIPVTFAYFLAKRSLWLGAASVIQFLALLFTQTRGGYLGIALAVFVFVLLYFGHKSPRRAKGAAGALIASIILIAFIFFTPFGQSLQQRLPDFTDRFLNAQSIKNAAGPRLEAWRAGWQGMLDKPLLGYGPENFFVAYDKHYSGFLDKDVTPIELSPWEAWFDKAHNFIFDIGVTTGFLGLSAYMAIFISAIWSLIYALRSFPLRVRGKAREGVTNKIMIGLIAALVGYLAQNLLGFDTTVPGIYLMFLLAYSNFIHNSPLHPPLTLRGRNSVSSFVLRSPSLKVREGAGGVSYGTRIRVLSTFTFITLAFLFVSSLKIHIEILRANHQLNLAEALAHSGRIEEGFAAFEKGLAYNAPPINPNLRRRYAVISLAYYDAVEKKCSTNEFSEEKCTWLYNDAKNKLARALELQKENAAQEWPRFTRNYTYAAQIANILGEYENSDTFFEQALKLSPGRKSIQAAWEKLRKNRDGLKIRS